MQKQTGGLQIFLVTDSMQTRPTFRSQLTRTFLQRVPINVLSTCTGTLCSTCETLSCVLRRFQWNTFSHYFDKVERWVTSDREVVSYTHLSQHVAVCTKSLWVLNVSAGEFISSGNKKRFKPGREWTTELWSSDDRDDKDVRRSSPLTVGANRKLYGLRNVEAVWTVCHQRNFPGTCVPSVSQVRCTDTWWNNITATCLKHKEYRRLFHRDFSTFRPTGAYEKSEGRQDCFKKYLQDYTDWSLEDDLIKSLLHRDSSGPLHVR